MVIDRRVCVCVCVLDVVEADLHIITNATLYM